MIVRGDARRLPLRDGSVDLVVTSPPYFGLRSYGAGPGEIGCEPHWRDWLAALVEATREMVRVLKPCGSIFVDLGDKYSEAGPQNAKGRLSSVGNSAHWRQVDPKRSGIPAKSLMLLPERYRVACVDQLGLIARAVIIHEKPNGLPESMRDRVRRSHEDWIHLVKQPRYFAALDELREPHSPGTHPGRQRSVGNASGNGVAHRTFAGDTDSFSSLGKLPGSVWPVPSEPLRLPPWIDSEHYAAFGTEWPRRLILGWSPHGICTVCEAGRFPVVDRPAVGGFVPDPSDKVRGFSQNGPERNRRYREQLARGEQATIVGYACACTPYTDHPGTGDYAQPEPDEFGWHDAQVMLFDDDEENDEPAPKKTGRPPWREYHFDRWVAPPTRPAVVLDPFGGTGTTAHTAWALGRVGVSMDLSEGYCRIAADRTLAHQRAGKVAGRVNQERQTSLFAT